MPLTFLEKLAYFGMGPQPEITSNMIDDPTTWYAEMQLLHNWRLGRVAQDQLALYSKEQKQRLESAILAIPNHKITLIKSSQKDVPMNSYVCSRCKLSVSPYHLVDGSWQPRTDFTWERSQPCHAR